MHLYYWPEDANSSETHIGANLVKGSLGSGRDLRAPRSYVDENDFTL
jgi:hypothetical protein